MQEQDTRRWVMAVSEMLVEIGSQSVADPRDAESEVWIVGCVCCAGRFDADDDKSII
jgi:hypothetical protein